MTELRQTIDEIRFVIQEDAFAVTDQLTQCAADYAAHCREANARLRKCEEFLRQGLRSEAIHFAELAPNLLDVLVQLDFPERGEWVELLTGYALPAPEPLLHDVAAALNEAYAVQEPLKRLLAQHRLYALARCPLSQRLSVLRSLAECDSASGHWDADIREMELARFREIESEARVAVAKGQIDQLKNLVAELGSSQWLETAPATLLRELKSKGGNVARSQAREQLESLQEALHAAQSSMDLSQARQLRDAWAANQKIAKLSDADDLLLRVAPVLEWIDDEDRRDAAEKSYRRAVAELERQVDDNTLTSVELQRYGHAVEKCGRGIPDVLMVRYRNRLGGLQLGETRRNRLRIGGTVGAVLGVVAIICVAVYLGNESQRTRTIIVGIESMISDGHLDKASRLFDENAVRLTSEEGLALNKKLTAAQQTERERVAQFSAVVESGRQLSDLTIAEKAIKQARELASTADEKVIVGKLEASWKMNHDAAVARDEEHFRTQMVSATAKLKKVDEMLSSSATDVEMQQAMASVASEITALRGMETKVARALTSQATLLESRYGSIQKAYGETQRKKLLLEKLSSLLSSGLRSLDSESHITEYRGLLDQFIKEFPSDSRSLGFKRPGNADVVQATYARRKMVAEWKQFWPVDGADVESRIKSCATFVTDHPISPDRAAIGRYEGFLKSLQWRENGDDDSDQPVKIRIRALYSGSLIKDGHLLQGKDGKCYYLAVETDYTKRKTVTLKYVSGFNGELKTTKEMDVEQLETLKTQSPPQKVIADHVYQTVTNVPLEEWDSYLQKVSQSLITTKDVDDFLRYFLLLRTLQYAASGNSFLDAELKKTLGSLDDSQMDLSASWMDPFDPTAKSARQLAAVLTKRVTDLDGAWKRAAVSQEHLSQELFRPALPIGWVERAEGRKWVLRSNWIPESKHRLMCVATAGEDGIRNWLPVGMMKGSAVELEIPPSASLMDGTVVFATPLSGNVKTASVR